MYLNFESLAASQNPAENLKALSWPVTEVEKVEIFNRLVTGLESLLHEKQSSFSGDILRAATPILLSSVFNSVYTSLVVRRLLGGNSFDRQFIPSAVDNYSWLLNGKAQNTRIAEAYLRRHVSLRKYVKHSFSCDRFSKNKESILTINPTLSEFLRLGGLEPKKRPFVDWFNFWELSHSDNRCSDKHLVNSVSEAFIDAVGKFDRSQKLVASIQDYVLDTLAFCERRLVKLISDIRVGGTLSLYTATQGFIGTRLVSLSVLENGGEVLSFPHSGGSLLYIENNWCVEDLTASRVFCYNEYDKLKRELSRTRVDIGRSATLQVLPTSADRYTENVNAGPIKRVLYLGAGYPGDRFWPAVLPELIRLRLEIEILDALVEKNLEVIVKLHQKSTPRSVVEFFKDRYRERLIFDDMPLHKSIASTEKVDGYVCENITGGSLTEVIKTRKPVILITPFAKAPYIDKEALALFEKRVSIIQCRNDSFGMPTLPVEELYDVLDRHTHELDFEYVNEATNSLFPY